MLDVAIIGAGPGGAAAANGIRRAAPHLKVKVFERASQLRRVGFAIGMTGNGLSALEAIDPACAQKVHSCGLPDGPVARFSAQGEELSRVASRTASSVDGKSITVPWYQVQQSLLEFLPPNTLELGYALENVEVTPDGVVLGFHDMPDVRTKVAIGCDGNQSVLRQAVLGDGAPEFVGTAIWRGQTPIPASWPHPDTHTAWFMDRPNGNTAQLVRLTDGYMAWMVVGRWDRERAAELGSGRYIDATFTSPAAGTKLDRCLAQLGAGWSSYVLDLIRSTDPSMITEHGIFYREPEACQVWGKGPLSLLGDAAHLGTPMLAQGLNQALEDAAELGRAIGKYGATEEALREYERVRLPRSQKVQAGSVAIMKAFAAGGKVSQGSEQEWHQENPWCLQHKPEPLQVVQMV